MKKYVILLLVFTIVLVLFLQGCGGGGSRRTTVTELAPTPGPPASMNVVHVTDNITGPANWTSDNLYVLDDTIYVYATLTIDAGTIIKISPGYGMYTSGSGCIIASGNSADHIIFTSSLDDNIGGDTNSDSGTTKPAKGDWGEVDIGANGSTFNYCDFYYGGKGSSTYMAMLEVRSSITASITNCTFARSIHSGLNVCTAGTGTIITGNSFYYNTKPMWFNPKISLNDSNVFHHPSNSAHGNSFNGLWLGTTVTLNSDASWGETEVPYVLTNVLSVDNDLMLQPGVIIKFSDGSRIDIGGTGAVTAIGNASNHITFTSIADDTKGGDTNNSTTPPAKGDWTKVHVGADGSTFNYCDFYYGGEGTTDNYAMMVVNFASVSIDNCTFAHSQHAALDLMGAEDTSIVTNNAFYDNTIPLWMNPDFTIPDDSNDFHNPANPSQKNTKNGIFLQTSQTILHNHTWGETEVPYVASFQGFVISDGVVLTIASSAILKFDNPDCGITIGTGASISGFNNLFFTSYKDDSRGGDTNGNGASSGAPGDWDGIWSADFPGDHYVTGSNLYFATHH